MVIAFHLFGCVAKVMETNMIEDSLAGNISHSRWDGGAATCDRKYGSRLKKGGYIRYAHHNRKAVTANEGERLSCAFKMTSRTDKHNGRKR